MAISKIPALRLVNQFIAEPNFKKAEDVVSALCAMQAQEYAMAKWAIGLRCEGLKDADVEKAFNDGRILRTHLMRPTWHFVCPEDIRWLLELTGPRVQQLNAYYYRQQELDNKIFIKCHKVLEKVLEGNQFLTRNEIKGALEDANIATGNLRLGSILMHAELERLICSGPRIGKQFTYALLEERAPKAKKLNRDETLAQLTRCYFTTRGPATVQDFSWWSGLTIADCREGIGLSGKDLITETTNGQQYILSANSPEPKLKASSQTTFLLPDYDEYGISYKDRSDISAKNVPKGMETTFSHMIVIDGIFAGTWKPGKTSKGKVEITLFPPISKAKQAKVEKAVRRYEGFVKGV